MFDAATRSDAVKDDRVKGNRTDAKRYGSRATTKLRLYTIKFLFTFWETNFQGLGRGFALLPASESFVSLFQLFLQSLQPPPPPLHLPPSPPIPQPSVFQPSNFFSLTLNYISSSSVSFFQFYFYCSPSPRFLSVTLPLSCLPSFLPSLLLPSNHSLKVSHVSLLSYGYSASSITCCWFSSPPFLSFPLKNISLY